MAYYTALQTEWATLTGTTAQKLAAINALTVTGAVPTSLYATGAQVANCINWTEFAALTAAQQSTLLQLCAIPGQLLCGSGNTSNLVDGMILAYFTNKSGPTIAALTALAQAAVQPWWQANGYTSPVNANDLVAAGGLT
jgi:hypothetical protein